MPRIGMNPSRGKVGKYTPEKVTVAVLTYLPDQVGYFRHRFDVTRLCIQSIVQNTTIPYNLMVFDNGSVPELTNYLQHLYRRGVIDYLFLSSRNIGKLAALQMIARSSPGDVLAYTDDDVFFMQGWLEKHLEILETFPNAGLVTGFYIRDHLKYGTTSLENFINRPDVKVRKGYFWDDKWIQHFVDNMGRTREQYADEMRGLEDILLEFRGVRALASAGHHQFVVSKDVLLRSLPNDWPRNLMGQMVALENKVDEMGYLRLSTPQPVTMLLGNKLDENMVQIARQWNIDVLDKHEQSDEVWLKWIYQRALIRKIAGKLYNWAYNVMISK